MTIVTFYVDRKSQGVLGFCAEGHTGFAKAGEDIVCAAISALTQATVTGLQEVVKVPVELQVRDGYLICQLRTPYSDQQWVQSQVLLETLRLAITGIYDEYQQFVKIKEVRS